MTTYARKPCAYCGREHNNAKYCCLKCQKDFQRQQRREKIEKSGKLISRVDRWYLIETRGYKCEICGNEEWLGKPILLILDHINGDSNNWSFKSRNKGNGRFYRRQRYADGKSY